MRWLLLLVVLSAGNGTKSRHDPLRAVWSELYPETTKNRATREDCAGCAQNRVGIVPSDPIFTEMRVEFVKDQILKKLRLAKPPDVSLSITTLPKPLISGNILELETETVSGPEKQVESFYGKTDQIVVFPKEDVENVENCRRETNHLFSNTATACFSFDLPNEMRFVSVTSAELWLYKYPDEDDAINETFVISELGHWDDDRRFAKNSPIAIFEAPVGEGWVKSDVSFTVTKWVEKQKLHHSIQVTCSSCSTDHFGLPVSTEQPLQPFLVIHTSPLPQKNRPKRNSNCLPETRECCRGELYIDFREIGWGDWILHPRGYHAYFCRGSCSSAGTIPMQMTGHSNVMRKYFLKIPQGSQKRNQIVPCCSPTQLSPIQLLYVDANNTLTRKTLPNMVVEACGCM